MKKGISREPDNNLKLLQCSHHGKKLKYICPEDDIDLSKFLLCSKCLISESDFVTEHKKNIFELNDYFSFYSQ